MEGTVSSEQLRLTGFVEQVLPEGPAGENMEYTQYHQPQHQASQVMKVREFEYHYRNPSKEDDSVRDRLQKAVVLKCSCSGKCLCDCVQDKFPVVEMIKTYKFKKNVMGDIIAGISVGVLQVPQGLSFALLAGLPPIYGLYSSFFPTIFYILFGTSRHVSVGATSLTSIMVHSLVVKIQNTVEGSRVMNYDVTSSDNNNVTSETPLVTSGDQTVSPETIGIIIGVTLLVGLMQVLMSVFRLGFVTTYLSDTLVAGFASAVSFHVYINQFKHLFGVKVKSRSGPLSLVYLLIDLCKSLPMTNIAALITSIICFLVLVIVRKFVNERYKSILRVPVPIDLIVVIITTLLSHFCKFSENFDLQIVKQIPNGVPKPILPDLVRATAYTSDAFSLAVISFSGSFLMVKIFSQRHDYSVRPNQELFAIGMAHVASSFFSCFCFTSVPARCFLHDAAGGKTQVAHLVAAVLVLLVMLFLSFLLQSLPICVLACLIIVACLPLAGYFRFAKIYWETDKFDFLSFWVTFFVTLLVQIDYGLFAGVMFSLLTVVFRTQTGKNYVKARIENTEFYVNKNKYLHTQAIPGVVVVYFEAPLYFATASMFEEKVLKLARVKSKVTTAIPLQRDSVTLNTVSEINIGENHRVNGTTFPPNEESTEPATVTTQELHVPLTFSVNLEDRASGSVPPVGVHTVVVDCTAVLYVDTSGLDVLLKLYRHYTGLGVAFCLANLTDDVKNKLKRIDKYLMLWKQCAYLSIHDAVTASVRAHDAVTASVRAHDAVTASVRAHDATNAAVSQC